MPLFHTKGHKRVARLAYVDGRPRTQNATVESQQGLPSPEDRDVVIRAWAIGAGRWIVLLADCR